MAALKCEICGGRLQAQSGGLFECEYCGLQYDKIRVQEMVQEIKGTVAVEGTVQVSGTVQVDSTTANQKLVQRMYIALNDGEFVNATQLAEQILETDPENADAYLGKLMAKKKIPVKEKLLNLYSQPDNTPEYKNAMKYGSEEMKRFLTETNKAIIARKEKSYANNCFYNAENNFENGLYEKAIDDYNGAASHHDVSEKINKCKQMIYARDNFCEMCEKACDGSDQNFNEAYAFFQEYKEYGPCAKADKVCQRILNMAEKTLKTDKGLRNQIAKEVKTLNEKKQHKSAELKQLGLFAKKDKKNALRDEIAAIDSELQPLLTKLYAIDSEERDYQNKCQDLNDELKFICNLISLKNAKQGQTVTFGRYYKNSNSLQPLTWMVFKVDTYLYLLTDNVIDSVPFGTVYTGRLAWKDSELYRWLNGTFYNTAFKDYEKEYIVEVTEPTEREIPWGKKYSAKATGYAISRKVTTKNGYSSWFLKCDCSANYCPDTVTADGIALRGYSLQGVLINNLRYGVRPMVVIDLEKIK